MSDIAVSLELAAPATRLADPVRVTLTVTGPAPLRVEPAGLDVEAATAWTLTAVGPPAVEGGRWVQQFRADPFVPGEAVRLGLAPVSVWAGGAAEPRRLTPAPVSVRVTTGVADVSATAARPTTGVEDVPTPGRCGNRPEQTVALAAGVVGLLVAALLAAPLFRRRRPVMPPDPLADLADLSDVEFAHRLSDAVRDRLHTDALPARRLTTPELPAGPARELLERLDVVRFGGRPLTAAERAAMLEASGLPRAVA